ncbi:MAG: pyridoxal-phosphate dependent enzyme [Oscillospiraceae bacterium]|nr:pyridoxal-phosphate dependent enzyme [Oscillospiraceae bacterium]
MIDLTIHSDGLARNIARARANGIVIPTFAQMKDPSLIPQDILDRLSHTGLWDVDPVNLFRVNWHNEPKRSGGLFGTPNYIEFPSALTGVPCRIVALVGKWFPTGCHKVGASFGCLVPRLVTGQFDADRHKAVWPSTGNYCRGGAFNSKLLGVHAIGILPEDMSRERFDWLRSIGAEIIATPGCESNVKEIFDKTHELAEDPSNMIFNQFEQMGNHLWHYEVTGNAIAEVFEHIRRPGDRMAGACFTTGSAGAIGSGDRLKELYPTMKLAAGEALQCPTLLDNGFGGHRIEGIGDKHVPWIHNVRNTDMVIDIDDNDSQELLRLFNEPEGADLLIHDLGLDPEFVQRLSWLGISGIANLLCCIKMAKYYEFTGQDMVFTLLTDSAEMYGSRLEELQEQDGPYTHEKAAVDCALHLQGQKTDNLLELTYTQRKRVHNLKYYTWVEQQGKTAQELNDLWYGTEFADVHTQAAAIDELIEQFNQAVKKG